MAWARIDDGFDDHPKVLSLGNNLAAIGLWTVALTYAHRNARVSKRPGFVPFEFLLRYGVATELAMALAIAELWEAVEDGWIIHDFDDYLPSTRPSAELSAKRAAAGRKGAEARWGKRYAAGQAATPSPDSSANGKQAWQNMATADLPFLPSTSHGNANGEAAGQSDPDIMAKASSEESEAAGHVAADSKLPMANMAKDGTCHPRTRTITTEPPLASLVAPTGASAAPPEAGVDVIGGAVAKIGEAKVAKRRGRQPKVASRIDPAFMPSEKLRAWFVEGQYGRLINGPEEHGKFVDYWLADNTPKALKRDWDAAWRYWMRNAYGYAQARGGRPMAANGKPVSSKTESAMQVMDALASVEAKQQLALGG